MTHISNMDAQHISITSLLNGYGIVKIFCIYRIDRETIPLAQISSAGNLLFDGGLRKLSHFIIHLFRKFLRIIVFIENHGHVVGRIFCFTDYRDQFSNDGVKCIAPILHLAFNNLPFAQILFHFN